MSKFGRTSLYSVLSEGYNLEEVVFPDDLDMSGVTNVNYILPGNLYTVKEYNFYKINVNTNIGTWYSLSRRSLLALLNKLPQISSTKTLTLGKINKLKLTPEEIAIGTPKGWTVA